MFGFLVVHAHALARAPVVVLSLSTTADTPAARHDSEVRINVGLFVLACDAAVVARTLEARRLAVSALLDALVAGESEADVHALHPPRVVVADELLELVEVSEHYRNQAERLEDLVVGVELLAETLLEAEAAV